MTQSEFQRKYSKLNFDIKKSIKFNKVKPLKVNAPDAFDWRDQGAVNHIKDQSMCGSCWAFASCANLEGQYYLKYKEAMTFSEQQLVDCDYIDDGNFFKY